MNTPINTKTGTYIAAAGVLVALLSHFGILLNAQQLGQTVTDGITFFGDLAVIWGVIHQFITTKKVVAVAKANGVKGLK